MRRRHFLTIAGGAAGTALASRGPAAAAAGPGQQATDPLEELFSGLTLYWGDLHSHTGYSDGLGTPASAFDYGSSQKLDFCAVSDHAEWVNRFEQQFRMADGSPAPLWANLVNEIEARYQPGRFVTFPSFEWTNDAYGHRNVVLLHPEHLLPNPPSASSHPTPDALWAALEPYPAMTIPHHVTRWGTEMDWSYYNPVTDRLVEIYSKWGSDSYERMKRYQRFPFLQKLVADSSVRAMLARGHRIGIIAGTDSHQGHPGSTAWDQPQGTILPKDQYPTTGEEFLDSLESGYTIHHREPEGGNGGLAGVWAPDLTREAIWEGLYARRTLGASGIRPVVKFGVRDAASGAGATMGGELTVTGDPILHASAVPEAGSVVTRLILLKTNARLHTATNPLPGVAVSFRDTALAVGETACYRALVRVRQSPEGNLDGDNVPLSPSADLQLDEQVWTSPIWVTRASTSEPRG